MSEQGSKESTDPASEASGLPDSGQGEDKRPVTSKDDSSSSGTSRAGDVRRVVPPSCTVGVIVKADERDVSVVKVEGELVVAEDTGGTPSDSDEEVRMQIRLSVSSDGDDESLDSDTEEFPTTITMVEDTAADVAEAPAQEQETFIPTTFDVEEQEAEPNVIATSADAYNSFWKYKKLPKGPKVQQTFTLAIPSLSDPHKPLVFNDPVFDKSQTNTVVHYGKARVGEGNDITPNPNRLTQLGKDIQKINERMSSLGNTSENKKEKMKLSSRICRMKRSANHEANKIKFAGLEQEREELCRVIREIKRAKTASQEPAAVGDLPAQLYQTKVAGRTSEYVNSVLEGEQLPGAAQYIVTDTDTDSD